MKKVILTLTLFYAFNALQAQIDVKIDPFSLVFSGPKASFEFGVTKNIALEPLVHFALYPLKESSSFQINSAKLSEGNESMLNAKYYFSKKRNINGFYVGMYVRKGKFTFEDKTVSEKYTQDFASIGFSTGFKWAFKNRLVLASDGGFGRKLHNRYDTKQQPTTIISYGDTDLDGFFFFSIGYRLFERKK